MARNSASSGPWALDPDARDVLDQARTDLQQILAKSLELSLCERVCLRNGFGMLLLMGPAFSFVWLFGAVAGAVYFFLDRAVGD
jgi:hypothetical protein